VDRHVAATDVDAVGTTCPDEIRPVIEDEERAVLLACHAKRLGRGDERVVLELLVAQLDDVDAAAQCGREEPVALRIADEVETGRGQALA
jgi:hypothetical protein